MYINIIYKIIDINYRYNCLPSVSKNGSKVGVGHVLRNRCNRDSSVSVI